MRPLRYRAGYCPRKVLDHEEWLSNCYHTLFGEWKVGFLPKIASTRSPTNLLKSLDGCQTHMIEFHYLLKKGTTMGDRANFGIRQNDGNTIFVYGHWAGHNMLAKFANALDHTQNVGRIDDPAYGTRIIISQLIGHDWSSELGWGITINYLSDNEHKVPVFDFSTREVSLYDYDWKSGGLTDKIVTFSLNDFIRKYAKSLIGV